MSPLFSRPDWECDEFLLVKEAELSESQKEIRPDAGVTETSAKQKGRPERIGTAFCKLLLAATYVPASFPAQYHRPGEA